MQVVHDHPQARARPDTVFCQWHNTRARWRDPGPGYYSEHQAHVCYLGLLATFPVVRPPLFGPWEGSNYSSWSCNGHNGPKGPKSKQNKQTHVCCSCGQHREQGKSKPLIAHSILPSRCPTIEIQLERADVCVLLQRSIDFRIGTVP